jgi:hypothetical protein
MDELQGITLPPMASDEPRQGPADLRAISIPNPIAGKATLTPYEIVDAISILSATLVAIGRERTIAGLRAPE